MNSFTADTVKTIIICAMIVALFGQFSSCAKVEQVEITKRKQLEKIK